MIFFAVAEDVKFNFGIYQNNLRAVYSAPGRRRGRELFQVYVGIVQVHNNFLVLRSLIYESSIKPIAAQKGQQCDMTGHESGSIDFQFLCWLPTATSQK